MNCGEDLREELTKIAKISTAIANSGCKGYIKLHNIHYKGQGVEQKHLDLWKECVRFVLGDLLYIKVIGRPSDIFHFGKCHPNDEYMYLHVQVTKTPLLVHTPLRLNTFEGMKQFLEPDEGCGYKGYVVQKDKIVDLASSDIDNKIKKLKSKGYGE